MSGAPDPAGPPSTPTWVKVLGLVVLAVVLVAVVVALVTGGEHGPGMHGSDQDMRVQPTGPAAT